MRNTWFSGFFSFSKSLKVGKLRFDSFKIISSAWYINNEIPSNFFKFCDISTFSEFNEKTDVFISSVCILRLKINKKQDKFYIYTISVLFLAFFWSGTKIFHQKLVLILREGDCMVKLQFLLLMVLCKKCLSFFFLESVKFCLI